MPSLQMEMSKRMGYVNATEVRSSDFDLAKGNTVDGVRTHVSSVREGDKDKDALREDNSCLDPWLSGHCGNGW